ncbi:hypothetical protein BEL04_16340 [Mucilaginibacter sp. PPCGB 2223]|uniref:hypothetical protein n=1 Tax=Mucilaginibacter sp. PPCGB 2223 TaxID=1886027 RepID=UPI00082478C9|nr:hypothetical protein [Mucilaginibacter sp. PPCGB 2223]OCX51591.1 hypothetical protein BEL04_16340 [Mucilaginibacter sp. PPCGB 2223]
MFSEKDKQHRSILIALGCITIVLGILLFLSPPSIFPDPGWGFEVMRSMQRGGGFNNLISPDPANIAHDKSSFLSWWSPGQYLVPYFFQTVLQVNTGKAVAVTIFLCSILGLAGYYQLFKKLGFTPGLSAISVAFIASQNYFILPYMFYPGGEVLLFAFMGWYLYGCFGISKLNWQALLFLFAAGVTGFVCKSSYLWMYAAGLACVWINLSRGKKLQAWLLNGITIGIPAVVALAVIYRGYLSQGANPSDATGNWLIKAETFTYPLASPLLSGLSVDEMFNGLIYHSEAPLISYGLSIAVIIALAAGSLLLLRAILRKLPNEEYKLVFAVFYAAATVFFSYLYLKQASVSYEGRHFRILGMLAIPGLVYLLQKTRITRIAFMVAWLAYFGWESLYFGYGYTVNHKVPHGPSGLAQQAYDQQTLDTMVSLDAQHPNNAVFVINSPDIGAEIIHNRVLTLDIDDMDTDDLAELHYAGKAGTIYMLMPQVYVKNGIAAKIAKSFTGYHQFGIKQLSKDFYLYSASN